MEAAAEDVTDLPELDNIFEIKEEQDDVAPDKICTINILSNLLPKSNIALPKRCWLKSNEEENWGKMEKKRRQK